VTSFVAPEKNVLAICPVHFQFRAKRHSSATIFPDRGVRSANLWFIASLAISRFVTVKQGRVWAFSQNCRGWMWVETPDFSILISFLILPNRPRRAQRPSGAHGGVSADAALPTGASRRDAGAAGDNRARVAYPDDTRSSFPSEFTPSASEFD
jgi:hypothetical protein